MRKLLIFFLLFPICVFSQSLDLRMVKHIHLNRNQGVDNFNKGLGQSADYVAIATPISIFLAGSFSDNVSLKKKGIQSGIAVLGTYGIGYLMKKTIKRDRPFVDNPFIVPVQYKDSYSMPSGSTALAFAAATSLTTTFPKWYVAVPSFAYAGAVGYSRIRSGEHYPTDVLVGAALGTASVWVSGKLMKWVNK